ncbi:MAG: hypothetical protein WC321_00760 [Candidatus Omnitrophota bacterium]
MRDKPIKIRKVWVINPATRVKKSKKVYSRQKLKQETKRITRNGK